MIVQMLLTLFFYFVLLYSILFLLMCHRVSVEAVIRAPRCSQLTACHSDTQSDGQAKVDLRMPASSSLLACFDLFPFLLFTCLLIHTHILGVSHGLMYCLYYIADSKKWQEKWSRGPRLEARLVAFLMLCVSGHRQDAPHSHSFAQLRVSVWPERVLGCEVSRLLFSGGTVCIIGMERVHRSLSALP